MVFQVPSWTVAGVCRPVPECRRSFGQANYFLVTLIVKLHGVKAWSFSSQRWIGIYVRPPGGPDLRGGPGRLTSTPQPDPLLPGLRCAPCLTARSRADSSPSRGVVAPLSLGPLPSLTS